MISWPFCFLRYCGYCPQFKYQIGETFGRTTSQLLTTSSVASSGRPVLSDIVPQPRPPRDNRRALIAGRCLNLGDQKLCDEMVPNYTGKRINYVCFLRMLVLHGSRVLALNWLIPLHNPRYTIGCQKRFLAQRNE